MEKLSFYGIGPKIARIMLPWLAITIALTLIFKNAFVFSDPENRNLYYTGLVTSDSGACIVFFHCSAASERNKGDKTGFKGGLLPLPQSVVCINITSYNPGNISDDEFMAGIYNKLYRLYCF